MKGEQHIDPDAKTEIFEDPDRTPTEILKEGKDTEYGDHIIAPTNAIDSMPEYFRLFGAETIDTDNEQIVQDFANGEMSYEDFENLLNRTREDYAIFCDAVRQYFQNDYLASFDDMMSMTAGDIDRMSDSLMERIVDSEWGHQILGRFSIFSEKAYQYSRAQAGIEELMRKAAAA
ncbi:MAG: hypothetical protein ABH846_04030 [Patescibacteria group bacterium]